MSDQEKNRVKVEYNPHLQTLTFELPKQENDHNKNTLNPISSRSRQKNRHKNVNAKYAEINSSYSADHASTFTKTKILTKSSTFQNKKKSLEQYFLTSTSLTGRNRVSKINQRHKAFPRHQKQVIHKIPTGGSTLDLIHHLAALQQEMLDEQNDESIFGNSTQTLSPRSKRQRIRGLWRKAYVYACTLVAIYI